MVTALLGFFSTDLLGPGVMSQVVRLVLLALLVGQVYLLWTAYPEPEPEPDSPPAPAPSAEDVRPAEVLMEAGSDTSPLPGRGEEERMDFYRELGQFFQNLIQMVRATFVAHSSVLFLRSRESGKLRIEFCDSKDPGIRPGMTVDIEGTLPGSVFRSQSAVLEQNLPDSGAALGYAAGKGAVKSFLAVPVRIRGEVRGVLAVDSQVANDFSKDDLQLLGSYEQLISQGISLLSERERSQLISQFLRALEVFLSTVEQDLSPENVYSALGKSCRSLYQFDRLTIARPEEKDSRAGRIMKVLGQRDDMGEGFIFPLEDGLMGWVLRKGKPLLLDDLEKGELFRPRYSREERTNYGLRSFLGVPILFMNRLFGALSLESRAPDFYSEWDQFTLELLALNAGLALHAAGAVPPDEAKAS